MQTPGVTVPEDVRAGLLAWYGNSQTKVIEGLRPPYSTSTAYRAITGKPVGEEVRSWFQSRYWSLTMRSLSNDDLNDALQVALKALQEKVGKRIHIDDMKREIGLMLKQEEQS